MKQVVRWAPPPGTVPAPLSCLSQLPPMERTAGLELIMGLVATSLPMLLSATGGAGMVQRVCESMEKSLARSRLRLPVRGGAGGRAGGNWLSD